MRRRTFLQTTAAALAAPALVRAETATTLKFVPYADLALLDPALLESVTEAVAAPAAPPIAPPPFGKPYPEAPGPPPPPATAVAVELVPPPNAPEVVIHAVAFPPAPPAPPAPPGPT